MSNLKLAFRQFCRNPGFTVAAVLTLAVGIGAKTALFSVFKAVGLEPFSYPEAHRLVHAWRTSVGHRWHRPLSAPDFFDFRERNTSFEEIGVYSPYGFNLGGPEPVRVSGALCSSGVLRALGVAPMLGHLFTEVEETDGSRPAVLSHATWRERFERAPDIVGRPITISGESHQMVGVCPRTSSSFPGGPKDGTAFSGHRSHSRAARGNWRATTACVTSSGCLPLAGSNPGEAKRLKSRAEKSPTPVASLA